MQIKKLFTIALPLLCSALALKAQISSSSADHRDSLSYSDSPGRHPLFVFHQQNGLRKPGSLQATLPGDELYTFEWSRYEPGLPGFAPAFISHSNQASSTVSELEEGGYRVRISNSDDTDTLLYAWVMLDELGVDVEKTTEGLVPAYKYTCDFLVISGSVKPDTLFYFDPFSNRPEQLALGFRFKWSSDNDKLDIPNDTTILDPNITYQPPFEDSWYILRATDDAGMSAVDSVRYESIQTKAEFHMEYLDKVTGAYDAKLTGDWSADKGSLDAPLTVRFRNTSLNGARFEWTLLDTLGGTKVEELTTDTSEFVEFSYRTADKYYNPYLVSESEAGCTDTFRLEDELYVEPSQLEVPNVFSPNNDGTNDRWVFKHQSLSSCHVTIVDRSGKVVYKKKIEDIYSWDGWDGNVHESNRRAPEGQYMYIIEATGYDGMSYKEPTIFENWKLKRGKRSGNSGSGSSGDDEGEGENNGTRYTGWLYLFRGKGEY